MAPNHSRQLLMLLPTAAILLSYLWFKKKKIIVRSDTGDTGNQQGLGEKIVETNIEESKEVPATEPVPTPSSPNRTFGRSLSGVESAPIDIVIPPSLRSSRSNPVVVSDEDLDLEIEKIKSMKNGTLSKSRPDNSPRHPQSKSYTPTKRAKSQNSNSPSLLKENITGGDNNQKANKINPEEESVEMKQKSITGVEEQLSSLNINNNNKQMPTKQLTDNEETREQDELQRRSSERDSANNSPVEAMLGSPSLSSISDEGSSDSGKGGSDEAGTPPPLNTLNDEIITPCDADVTILYEFVIPQSLVGKLIGRHGSFVTQIKDKTHAHIVVRKHPTNNKLKVCSVEGKREEVDKALKMIRDKFPSKRYPEITLEEVHFTPMVATVPLNPHHLYVKLVEGINNDTIVSCMMAPNHLFLQQPTHPAFPSLNVLTNYMNACYSQTDSPLLPTPIPERTVCAAFSVDSWLRGMVLSTDPETNQSYVKFLDYGGCSFVEHSNLRQIRGDFLLLPFQAAECYLANIRPASEDGSWAREAFDLVADLTKGSLIYTQIVAYTEAEVPLVLCYLVIGSQLVCLNQQLVDSGFAVWEVTEEPADPREYVEQEYNVDRLETVEQVDNLEGAVGGVIA